MTGPSLKGAMRSALDEDANVGRALQRPWAQSIPPNFTCYVEDVLNLVTLGHL